MVIIVDIHELEVRIKWDVKSHSIVDILLDL